MEKEKFRELVAEAWHDMYQFSGSPKYRVDFVADKMHRKVFPEQYKIVYEGGAIFFNYYGTGALNIHDNYRLSCSALGYTIDCPPNPCQVIHKITLEKCSVDEAKIGDWLVDAINDPTPLLKVNDDLYVCWNNREQMLLKFDKPFGSVKYKLIFNE